MILNFSEGEAPLSAVQKFNPLALLPFVPFSLNALISQAPSCTPVLPVLRRNSIEVLVFAAYVVVS